MPTLKSKTYRKRTYTLIEMMAVIVLVGFLMNMALLFYYKSRKINSQYTEKAVQIKSVSIVSKYLRSFVHNNGETFMVNPDKVVFKNGSVMAMADNRLVFTANNVNRSLTLPKGFAATFALERNPEEPPCIIMNIVMLNSKDQPQFNKFTRIAASAEGVAQ